MKEFRYDTRIQSEDEVKRMAYFKDLIFKFNHTLPSSPEYLDILHTIFKGKIGEKSMVNSPLSGTCFDEVKIGSKVVINSNCLMMARGGITIEDKVMIAANCQLISNNHDVYVRDVLTCKEVIIKEGAWIGAGATILPGVTIGKYAIVGAGSVVTKDVGDYEVVVGNPARVIKVLDKEKFYG